jgi:hypothetical protein
MVRYNQAIRGFLTEFIYTICKLHLNGLRRALLITSLNSGARHEIDGHTRIGLFWILSGRGSRLKTPLLKALMANCGMNV